MTTDDLAAEFRKSAYLREIDDQDLQHLAAFATRCELAEDAVIFREGDAAETIALIVQGTVSLEVCTPGIGCRRVSTLGAGELLGWSPVLDHGQLTATARAVTAVQLVEVPKDPVLALCEANPRFGYHFMRAIAQTLARRLTAARMQLLDVYGHEERS